MISGRTLLLALIALNLLALAWWSGAMDPLIDDGREPGRLGAQIQPERLELIGPVTAADRASASDGDQSAATGLPGLAGAASQVSQAQQRAVLPASEALADAAQTARASLPAVQPAAADAAPVEVVAVPESLLPPARPAVEPRVELSRDEAGGDPLTPGPAVVADVPDVQFPGAESSAESARARPPADSVSESETYSMPEQAELPLIAAAVPGAMSPSLSTVTSTQTACIRYSGLSYLAIRELEDEYLGRGASIDMRRLDRGNYLVYIEPLASLPLALRKQEQLKRLGVRDMHIIKLGPYRNAISLGLLRTYERAATHMARMRDIGVTTMRIGPVNASGSRYEFTIRGPVALIEGEVRQHPIVRKRFGREC